MADTYPVLVVGSGNAEFIINLDRELRQDHKYVVQYHEFFGGSGVNYSMRLLHAGIPVYPILSVGKDEFGVRIKNEILSCVPALSLSAGALEYVNSDNFFTCNFKTPRATIIVNNKMRTIFSEHIEHSKCFHEHLDQCLKEFSTLFPLGSKTIMIGHILADNPQINPDFPGACTREIIRSFYKDSLIFTNFGYSQICLGADFWEEDLKKVGIFQLNLKEMKSFFREKHFKNCLIDILEWLRQREITAIITLDRHGAIGTYKDGKDGVIMAWPKEFPDVVDTTGAGDAFGAGLISRLRGKPDFTCDDFFEAIEEARIWAAYACTQLGAAATCPDCQVLDKFHKTFTSEPIEVLTGGEARRMLKVFDKL